MYVGHDFLFSGMPLCQTVRRVAQYGMPNPIDVPKPEIAKGLLHLRDTDWIHLPDPMRSVITTPQANEREDQYCQRRMYLARTALHRCSVECGSF